MKRIVWIDNAKFLGIYLVILGHSIPASEEEYSIIRNFIYAFHMPLFVFLSGFLYKRGNIKKDVLCILVPYLIYQVTNLLWILKGNIIHISIDWEKMQKMCVGILLGNGYETTCSTPQVYHVGF